MSFFDFLRSLQYRIVILVLFGFSILLLQIPLFNYLGYEFSVASAIILSFLSGFVTTGLFSSSFRLHPRISRKDFFRFQRRNLLAHLILLLIPLTVATMNILAVRNCSYLEGVQFYLLIPVITMLFSTQLAGFCAVLVRHPRSAFFLLLALILLHPVWLGYWTPQIYSYNFIYGFFPGFSYDEVLKITPTLVFFRVLTLIASVVFLLLSRFFIDHSDAHASPVAKILLLPKMFSGGRDGVRTAMIACVLILLASWIFRTALGFETSLSAIEQQLSKRFPTEHFVIHYSPDSFSDEEVQWVGAEHEFALHQVQGKLQVATPGHIDSYIYPSAEAKQKFIGVGTTNIAKPWRREIHINADSWQHVLKHELVHVVAGDFGMPVIRANYKIGLVEGLAMAVDWEFGNRTLHEYAAAMENFGLIKDVRGMMSFTGFATQTSSVSYVLSGSFCRFLMDRYGIIRMKELYGGSSFTSVYGKTLAQLVKEWKDFLARLLVPEAWKPHVKFYFDRKSIFSKDCARYIAALNENAARELNHHRYSAAMVLYRTSLDEIWNSDAFAGLIRAAYVAAEFDTVIQRMQDRSGKDFGVGNLMVLSGDALWAKGKILDAQKSFEQVLALDISESMNEIAVSRMAVLKDEKLRVLLLPFILQPDSVSVLFLEKQGKNSNNPIVPFLLARALFRMRSYERARVILDGSRQLDNPVLGAAREKMLGICCFHLRKFQQARAHFWRAMNFTTNESSALRLHDWIDRCEWFEENEKRKKEKNG